MKMKNKITIAVLIIVVVIVFLAVIGNKHQLISKSYIGTYELNDVDGYYLGKGTNDDDKMEYIFQTEPIDDSKTLSDNIDVTKGVTIKNSYTKSEKDEILKVANTSISKKSMDIFKKNLGEENTVSVFAGSYKDISGKIKTAYEYEIIINNSDIKDFDKK